MNDPGESPPRPMNTGAPRVAVKDRSARLRTMGVIQIVIGSISALLAFVSLLAIAVFRSFPALADAQPSNKIGIWASVITYGLGAIFFIWLGIGSLRFRRWVRPVVLAIMWPMGLSGLILCGAGFWMLPRALHTGASLGSPLPDAVLAPIAVGILSFAFILFVGLPGVHILLYQSKTVQQFCRYKDTKPRWTDRCPPGVLSIAVCLVLTAFIFLAAIPSGVFVFAGFIITGLNATIAYLVCFFCALILTDLVCRQKASGWWGTLVYFAVLFVGSALSFAISDIADIYRATGLFSEPQLDSMGPLLKTLSGCYVAVCLVSAVLIAGYLVCVRKLFFRSGPPPT